MKNILLIKSLTSLINSLIPLDFSGKCSIMALAFGLQAEQIKYNELTERKKYYGCTFNATVILG